MRERVYETGRDRRDGHRWAAANLGWDPNVTTGDVPVKFGDDATDAVKQYLQTFAMMATPLTERERRNLPMPEQLREENAPDFGSDPWARDGWELGRIAWADLQKRRKQQGHNDHWSHDICESDPNDPWHPQSPFANHAYDPWRGWSGE